MEGLKNNQLHCYLLLLLAILFATGLPLLSLHCHWLFFFATGLLLLFCPVDTSGPLLSLSLAISISFVPTTTLFLSSFVDTLNLFCVHHCFCHCTHCHSVVELHCLFNDVHCPCLEFNVSHLPCNSITVHQMLTDLPTSCPTFINQCQCGQTTVH